MHASPKYFNHNNAVTSTHGLLLHICMQVPVLCTALSHAEACSDIARLTELGIRVRLQPQDNPFRNTYQNTYRSLPGAQGGRFHLSDCHKRFGVLEYLGMKWALLGKAQVVSGWKNKIQSAVANVTPNAVLAERHRAMAEPGTAKD